MPAIIIPARLNSSRLPRKLLLDDTGFPLIWHTIKRALESFTAEIVLVATEDDELADIVSGFGLSNVYCTLTPPCKSGTERVAWVVENTNWFSDCFDYVVNFQGDEPDLPGSLADELIEELRSDNMIDVATVVTSGNHDDYISASVVKAVLDHRGNAMYFSRSPIPYGLPNGGCYNHFGIYAYRREFLLAVPALPPGSLDSECLEQLQWLQSGFRVKTIEKESLEIGVNTAEEYNNFVERYRNRQ